MIIPNAENALLSPEKLQDYLLNLEHEDGRSKAKALIAMGYSPDEWRVLEQQLREQHLTMDVATEEKNDYGTCYVIIAELTGPTGRNRLWRSVWQIDHGSDAPRLITMYPEKH